MPPQSPHDRGTPYPQKRAEKLRDIASNEQGAIVTGEGIINTPTRRGSGRSSARDSPTFPRQISSGRSSEVFPRSPALSTARGSSRTKSSGVFTTFSWGSSRPSSRSSTALSSQAEESGPGRRSASQDRIFSSPINISNLSLHRVSSSSSQYVHASEFFGHSNTSRISISRSTTVLDTKDNKPTKSARRNSDSVGQQERDSIFKNAGQRNPEANVRGEQLKLERTRSVGRHPQIERRNVYDAREMEGEAWVDDDSCRNLVRLMFKDPQINKRLLAKLLASKKGIEHLLQLDGEEAQAVVNAIDHILETEELHARRRIRYMAVMGKLCSACCILPTSHNLSQELEVLGDQPRQSGGFAEVWMGKYDSKLVAIKVLKTYSSDNQVKIKKRFCREVVSWKRLSHPNLLPLLGVSTSPFKFAMVSVWMPHGNIVDYVKSHPDVNRLTLLSETASGLAYLHSMDLVHGDLKGANILMNGDHQACLADFGFMAIMSDSIAAQTASSSFGGTIRWMAPELLIPEDFELSHCIPTKSSDVYAMGMVIYEIMADDVPFSQYGSLGVIPKVVNGLRPERPVVGSSRGLTDTIWAMVKNCWSQQIPERPTIAIVLQALNHASRSWELGLETQQSVAKTTAEVLFENAGKRHTQHRNVNTVDVSAETYSCAPQKRPEPFHSLPLPAKRTSVNILVSGLNNPGLSLIDAMKNMYSGSSERPRKSSKLGSLRRIFRSEKVLEVVASSPRQDNTFFDFSAGAPRVVIKGKAVLNGIALVLSAVAGIPGDTRSNLAIAFALGAMQLVVTITEMRCAKWSQLTFNRIAHEIVTLARDVGFNPGAICFVPAPDLTNASQPMLLDQLQLTMPWYKGWRKDIGNGRSILGGTLAEAIDTIGLSMGKERAFFGTICATTGLPSKVITWVHSGFIKLGAKLKLFPKNKQVIVKSFKNIPPFDEKTMDPESDWLEGRQGTLVEIDFETLATETSVGMILYDSRDGNIHETAFFVAQLYAHEQAAPTPVTSGPLEIRIYSGRIECHVAEVLEILDPSTGRILERNSQSLQPGRICKVMLLPAKPLYIEAYRDSQKLGRLEVLNKQGKIVATGFVESLEYKS